MQFGSLCGDGSGRNHVARLSLPVSLPNEAREVESANRHNLVVARTGNEGFKGRLFSAGKAVAALPATEPHSRTAGP